MLRRLLTTTAAAATLAGGALTAPASAQTLQGCASAPVAERFETFGRTGRMPPELARWLGDAASQIVEPYQAFDNVHYVGVCWVSAWIIRTPEGAVLIDTLHEPYVDQLIANIRKVGVDPRDIKLVLMTHGHFDHTGGAYKLKPLTGARFLMTQRGWDEALESSARSQGTPRAWTMLPIDGVVRDGDVLRLGGQEIRVYETPGHTEGTASFTFDVFDGGRRHRAVTVGGLGLNAIESSAQVASYIATIDRMSALIGSPADPVDLHLTTHPFSNGLTEAKEGLKTRQPGQPHPLVDTAGLRQQLASLRAGAVERLEIEKKAGR